MRDIKFRIWNDHGQCMHEWPELVEKNKIHLLNAKNPNYRVMQFTGLKDSKGVDIYEGDKVQKTATMPGDHDFFGVVEFMEGAFWISNGREAVSAFCETGELKVIGNIHENPELLEVVK